jgi:hypothetical protein
MEKEKHRNEFLKTFYKKKDPENPDDYDFYSRCSPRSQRRRLLFAVDRRHLAPQLGA